MADSENTTFKVSFPDIPAFKKQGIPFIWLTGMALAVVILMIAGMITLVLVKGLTHFWPADLWLIQTKSGESFFGIFQQHESIPESSSGQKEKAPTRSLFQIGGRDIYGLDFRWFDDTELVQRVRPRDAMVIERMEYGKLFGTLMEVRDQNNRSIAGSGVPGSVHLEKIISSKKRIRGSIRVMLADGKTTKELRFNQIVRVYRPNAMTGWEKISLYLAKIWEFLSADPRESNTEGGVFPAIFGTVMMVMIMTVAVVPLGVLAALYLHEYAREGFVVRQVRLAVNNLAGVPSIVFGMFGLGFFIYFVGAGIDRLFFSARLPTPTFGTGGILWASLTLALLTLPVVIVATEESLASVPLANREAALALSATKFQMIRHVVLPHASPGILTGMILAVARGAGEVAPLMITGVVKLAPALPVDLTFPFFHPERKFMHLGFHIYDVGFQSPNVEAAKPMVYTTALLLLLIVLILNAAAITLRNRLRKRYRGAAL
ncbi:MAG: phosphate ABC transporter permease PstA [Deltaproteobacteria bacterium]|nr:phosphate ABC transporter permease PstA [Deltaproteobacteria bacterium]MBW2308452.1 phosphate ABC transporter permease PstA [Deltaproteobacteria bacterium]